MPPIGLKRIQIYLVIYFTGAAASGLICLGWLLQIAGDPKNSDFFGFSTERLVLLLFLSLAVLTALLMALFSWFTQSPAGWFISILDKPALVRSMVWSLVIIIIVGWLVTFMPAYRFGLMHAMFERLRPIMTWFTFLSGESLILLLFCQGGFKTQAAGQGWEGQRKTVWTSLVALGIMLLLWTFISISRLGLSPDQAFWNPPGVPFLGTQMIFILVVLLIALVLQAWRKKIDPVYVNRFTKKDLLIFLALWLGAALAWNMQTLPPGFFAPGPYLPENVYAPYSDAAKFDAGAQFLLIGRGILNRGITDRPLYMSFLALLHAIAGQNYERVIALQVLVLAVFPAVLFLLGRSLHSRLAGILIGLLAVARELNTIAATRYIPVSHTRWMLTEFPTMLVVALFTYWMVRSLQDLRRQGRFNILSGAVLGFGTLLRANPWFLLPVGVLAPILTYGHRWRRWLPGVLLLMTGFFVTLLPWMVRSGIINHRPLYFMLKVNNVLGKRYLLSQFQRTPQMPVTPTPVPQTSSALVQSTDMPDTITLPKNGRVQFVANHFLHSFVGAVLILPTSFVLDDLERTLTVSLPYWQDGWEGQISLQSGLLLFLNLALVALGVGGAWLRWRWAGLVPLFSFIAYALSNGSARTSGGRYQIGMDWIVYVYFIFGLLQLIFWVADAWGYSLQKAFETRPGSDESSLQASFRRKDLVWLGIVFFVAALMPIAEMIIPPRYAGLDKQALVAWLKQDNILAGLKVDRQQVEQFLTQPGAVAIQGRALYPRYYSYNQGEHDGATAYRPQPYPRLVFRLIGPQGDRHLILPSNHVPEIFSSGSDVIVLGCKENTRIDPIVVLVMNSDGWNAYQRSLDESTPLLACPLPQPVCDDNHHCR